MANDIFAGMGFDDLLGTTGYGDSVESRVAPTGHTTHHDVEAYDEYTSQINPPADEDDPNNPYQKVEAAMNHVDTHWGENYDEPFDCMHPKEKEPHCHHGAPKHHHHPNNTKPRTVIDTPPMEQLTPDDVDEVYGYSEHNMKLLRVSSVRVSNLTNVLKEIQETDHGIDLVRIMEQVPFASITFREILEQAFNAEMKNYLNIISKLNKYIYGEPPAPEPEPTPEPEPEQETTPEESSENENVNFGEQVNNDVEIVDDNGTDIPVGNTTAEINN